MRIARCVAFALIIAWVVLTTRRVCTTGSPPPLRSRPAGIVVHHSATPAIVEGAPVDVRLIDRWHQKRGFGAEAAGRIFHVGYHYVILPDGRIQSGRPEFVHGAHAKQFNDRLGICLIGNFSSRANWRESQQPGHPTARQQQALVWLVSSLLDEYNLPVSCVVRHRDTGAITECPGDRLPFAGILRAVNAKVRANQLAPAVAPHPSPGERGHLHRFALMAGLVGLMAANLLWHWQPPRQPRRGLGWRTE